MNIGAQLYTVREFCQDLPSYAETLKKIADIGFRYVQVSGGMPVDASWLSENLKKNGLTCVLTHTKKDELTGNLPAVFAYHDAIHCDSIGLGQFKFDKADDSDYEEFKSTYGPIMKAIAKEGKHFCFHHHAREFKKLANGNTVFEQILKDFTPDECHLTFDTFWAQAGGANPEEWLRKLEGRTEHIHVKDYLVRSSLPADPKNYFAPVGQGLLNFPKILSAAEDIGVKTILIEQDNSYGEDPFACLQTSYDYLKAEGLS